MIWQISEAASFEMWAQSKPGEFMLVRRLILHFASWLERRLAMVYESFPLLTYAMADGRKSFTERRPGSICPAS